MTSGTCFTKTKIDFKLELNIAGHSCHWFLSSLVSQLWSLDNIFSFYTELSKNVNSVDLWPWFERLLRDQCQ